MHIVEPGNIICEKGHDELVFVRCLPPFDFYFRILCRECKEEGIIEAKADSLRTLPPKTDERR